MTQRARTLYGTTNKSGCVPPVLRQTSPLSGPYFSQDGRLILSKSFNDTEPLCNHDAFWDAISRALDEDDYVESWRIWDCYEQNWANIDLILHRFEEYDLVIRQQGTSVCVWHGAIDTNARVLASPFDEDNENKCWQWLRA